MAPLNRYRDVGQGRKTGGSGQNFILEVPEILRSKTGMCATLQSSAKNRLRAAPSTRRSSPRNTECGGGWDLFKSASFAFHS
jgi:hypothetical protein